MYIHTYIHTVTTYGKYHTCSIAALVTSAEPICIHTCIHTNIQPSAIRPVMSAFTFKYIHRYTHTHDRMLSRYPTDIHTHFDYSRQVPHVLNSRLRHKRRAVSHQHSAICLDLYTDTHTHTHTHMIAD